MEIDRALAQMLATGNSAGLTQMQAQSAEVASLLSRIATARPSDLATLQSEVIAVTAAAADSVEQARGGSASGDPTSSTSARESARRTVDAVMGGMKDFDPYLTFASEEDERAYRARERARQAQIDKKRPKAPSKATSTPSASPNNSCSMPARTVPIAARYGCSD